MRLLHQLAHYQRKEGANTGRRERKEPGQSKQLFLIYRSPQEDRAFGRTSGIFTCLINVKLLKEFQLFLQLLSYSRGQRQSHYSPEGACHTENPRQVVANISQKWQLDLLHILPGRVVCLFTLTRCPNIKS